MSCRPPLPSFLGTLALLLCLPACSSGVAPPLASSSLAAAGPAPFASAKAASPSPSPTIRPVSLTETPLPADALADSVGLNENVASTRNPTAAPDWQTLLSLLHGLGVRHVRSGILNADPSYDAALVALLGASNAKLDGITDCTAFQYYPGSATSALQVQQFAALFGSSLEAVEGPNEVDNRNDRNWAADTRGCLPSLHGAVPGVPFIAPSLANPYANAATLGNISANVDEGNSHRYFLGRNPGTAGWGGRGACGVYGALNWALCEARVNAGAKPVVITETGYNSRTEVDELTQAKYLSRVFLVNLQAGVAHSYIYCLRDSASSTAGYDGLIRLDDSTKPAYAAIASEIAYFSDPGSPITYTPFSYSIQTAVSTISHLLFQRRDGSFVLALWNETASWNTSSNTRITVAPLTVTINLGYAPSNVTAVALNDSGALVAANTSTTLDSVALKVDDHVTLLSFR